MSTIRTVIIGPVQTVEGYLNYTKLNYFTPPQLEDSAVDGTLESRFVTVFTQFP
jgi:hypothetical protein